MSCDCDMHGRGGMHCRGCCTTLSGLAAFDRHQKRHGGIVTCSSPAGLGLVEVRPGVWGLPSSEENRERLRNLRKTG